MFDNERSVCPTCGGRVRLDSVDTANSGAVALETSCDVHGQLGLVLVFLEVLPPEHSE